MPYTKEDKIRTAERLTDLRKSWGLSYMQLSKELQKTGTDISHTSLKDYEETDEIAHPSSFNKNMSIANLVALADFYEVSYDYLLGKAKAPERTQSTIVESTGLSQGAASQLVKLKNDAEMETSHNNEHNDKYGMLSLPLKTLDTLLSSPFLPQILDDIGLYIMGNFIDYYDYCANLRGQVPNFTVVDTRTKKQYTVDIEKVSMTFLIDLQNHLSLLKQEVEHNANDTQAR